MIRIIGALIIICTTSIVGYLIAFEFSNRTKQIRQLQNALLFMETEITYGYTPLEQILVKIGERDKGAIANLFLKASEELKSVEYSFHICWQNAMEKNWGLTSLKEKEKQILLQLGSTLGMSDRENQVKHLRIALTHLQSEEKDAHEAQIRYEKLSRALGILTGILLVVLMY